VASTDFRGIPKEKLHEVFSWWNAGSTVVGECSGFSLCDLGSIPAMCSWSDCHFASTACEKTTSSLTQTLQVFSCRKLGTLGQ
jgi:hypothetical protein